MKIRSLDIEFYKKIKRKKKFLADLITYTGLDHKLIRRAIHNMTFPPHECHEVFSKTPRIEKLKKNNPAEYKEILSLRKALSTLMNNSVINANEKQNIKLIEERIIQDFEIDLTDRKALMDNFRSQTDVNSIEDYKNYSDESFVWEIDKTLRTDQQCEGKLVTMLYDYLWQLTEAVNDKKPTDHQYNYKQKDVFELIAEILNLHWLNKYDYKKIRTLHRNYKTVKP